MGVEDSDCDCEMPLDMDDDELEAYCREIPHLRPPQPVGTSRLSGFIAFSRLCSILGKIVRCMNPLKMHRGRKRHAAERLNKQIKLAEILDVELAKWSKAVPDSIKFSANNMDLDSGSPHLTMCVILYIVHAGCVINLHR